QTSNRSYGLNDPAVEETPTTGTGVWARLSSGSQTSSASRNASPSPIHNGGGALSRQNWYARRKNSGAIRTPYDAQSIGPSMPESRHATANSSHRASGESGRRRRSSQPITRTADSTAIGTLAEGAT